MGEAGARMADPSTKSATLRGTLRRGFVMKLDVHSACIDARTKEYVQFVSLRFSPAEWRAYADDMLRAWPEGAAKADIPKSLAAIIAALTRGMGAEVGLVRDLHIPVEHATPEEYQALTAKVIARKAHGG